MEKNLGKSQTIAAVRRGQIIQRVLVDGWSAERTAAVFEVTERQVIGWVAAYRRRGMASLRRDEPTLDSLPRRVTMRLWAPIALLLLRFRREARAFEPASCIVLRRTDRDGGKRR